MKRSACVVLVLVLFALTVAPAGRQAPPLPQEPSAETRSLFARCNLKVLKGNTITWVNWQSTPTFVPAGSPLQVYGGPQQWYLKADGGTIYTLDAGVAGEQILAKFVTAERVDVSSFPEDTRDNIELAVARVGMTREQVYIAMGPPGHVDGNVTSDMTYEQIIAGNLWVYRRKRFGKNIGVQFAPKKDGLVTNTEGIWR